MNSDTVGVCPPCFAPQTERPDNLPLSGCLFAAKLLNSGALEADAQHLMSISFSRWLLLSPDCVRMASVRGAEGPARPAHGTLGKTELWWMLAVSPALNYKQI